MRWFHRKSLVALPLLTAVLIAAGCSSSGEDPAKPDVDSSGPGVQNVQAIAFDLVEVTFNEKVDRASAENPANYYVEEVASSPLRIPAWSAHNLVASPGDKKLATAATLASDGRKVTLFVETLTASTSYELHVSGVIDLAGNAFDNTAAPMPVVDNIRSGRIFTIAGTGIAALGDEDVPPTQSHLYLVQDVTIGPDGNLYVVDWNNHRIRVIQNGLIHTIIGTGILGDAPEGPALTVSLNHPTNVCFGPNGKLYMAAWHNSKIMEYDRNTQYLSVLASSTGSRGWDGDGEPAYDAVLNLPSGSAIGPDGNLYIGDQANHCIRMIDMASPDKIISTVVAKGHLPGFCGDGGVAGSACLQGQIGQSADPTSRIEFDSQGNLYLADSANHRVRKVALLTTMGENAIINTIAGNGTKGFGGDGGDALNASLNLPTDVALNPVTGNLYIADRDNNRVRMLDFQTGVMTTVAGNGNVGYLATDEGKPAIDARLYQPTGICFDHFGNLYIAEPKNHRVRVVYH